MTSLTCFSFPTWDALVISTQLVRTNSLRSKSWRAISDEKGPLIQNFVIPSNCRLRNLYVKEFCRTRSQRKGASSRAVWSQLKPREEITPEPNAQGEQQHPCCLHQMQIWKRKKLFCYCNFPSLSPSQLSFCSSPFFHQFQALTVSVLVPCPELLPPQRHTAGKGMKRDISPWKWTFARKSRSES